MIGSLRGIFNVGEEGVGFLSRARREKKNKHPGPERAGDEPRPLLGEHGYLQDCGAYAESGLMLEAAGHYAGVADEGAVHRA